MAADLAQRAVDRFDRVGRVDDLSDLWGEKEEGSNPNFLVRPLDFLFLVN